MKHEYQNLMENISVPEGLNDQVLDAVRQAPSRSRRGRVWKTAVCAACALTLVVGSVRLRPGSTEDSLPQLTYGFVLTAYAAGTGETVEPNANGGLAFAVGEGGAVPESGDFTGCLFRVTGEEIETVSLSVDRGGLYRYVLRRGLTEEEMRSYREAMEQGTLVTAAISQDENGVWSMPEMTVLGSVVTEPYDSAAFYGFWVSPEKMDAADTSDERWSGIDRFDGACLTVAVTFADGREQSKTYTLSTGRLRTVLQEDGTWTVLPQLVGDDEPYVYGIYAVSETESRWLQWPVRGANTISLSNDYGYRWNPGGQSRTFHAGIDIPAESGTPVLAAADGTVTETGFDTDRGNYLLVDHGDGLTILYAHCQSVDVTEGGMVQAGEQIATVGSTGKSTGPHLHFEVRQDGEAQNPTAYFDVETRAALRMA